MKKVLLAGLALAMFSLLFSSCKKDDNNDDNNNDNNNTEYYFTVKIDNETFSADVSNPAIYGVSKPNESSLAVVAVKNLVNPGEGQFQLNLGNTYTGPGTYDLGEGSNANNFASYTITENFLPTIWEANSDNGNGSSGTLTITSDANGVVEGTFQFAGIRTTGSASPGLRHFTEGKFKLKIN